MKAEDSRDYNEMFRPTAAENRAERRKQIALLQPTAHTDDEIREWWKDIGGHFFGPKVEHACIEEHKFLPAMRTLFDAFVQTREQLAKALEAKTAHSEFLDRCNHFYLQTDGSYDFPNSCEGDLLRIALKEIQ